MRLTKLESNSNSRVAERYNPQSLTLNIPLYILIVGSKMYGLYILKGSEYSTKRNDVTRRHFLGKKLFFWSKY